MNHIGVKSQEDNNLPAIDILGRITSLSQAMVLADSDDLQTLADIATQFESLGREAAREKSAVPAEAAFAAAALLHNALAEETKDLSGTLDILSQTLSAMQAIAEGTTNPRATAFPAELGYQGSYSPDQGSEAGVSTPDFDDEIFGMFLAEQQNTLQELESHILGLEKADNPDAEQALRRLVHTMKGEAGVLALTEVATLCHAVEDYLDDPETPVTTDCLLAVKDWLARVFDDYTNRRPLSVKLADVQALLRAPSTATETGPAAEEESVDPPVAEEEPAQPEELAIDADPTLLADFITEAREHIEAVDVHLLTLEQSPQDEEALNAVFRAFHTIKGVAGFLNLEYIGTLAHEAETLLGSAQKGEHQLTGPRIDVIFDANDMLKTLIEDLGAVVAGNDAPTVPPELPQLVKAIVAVTQGREDEVGRIERINRSPKKLGQILVDSGVVEEDDLAVALADQAADPESELLGNYLVRHDVAKPKDVAQALRHQRGELTDRRKAAADHADRAATTPSAAGDRPGAVPERRGAKVRETVRVDTDRLDLLVDTIGELVIAESMITQDPEVLGHSSDRLMNNLRNLKKVSRELQEMGTAMRMETLRGVFQKMARLVRDVAKKAGKKINFELYGEDTELDRTVIDRIGDPLIHMVRNAADHGIEAPEERQACGKPEEGRVQLRAFHQGGSVHIEIQDDGHGLNKDVLRAKGVERGVIGPDDKLSETDIYNLIFEPGFSTAKKVTDISGRGVGMDVVRRNIEALRGKVGITSEFGKGSTFRMTLPLTLAIIDGLVIKVGGQRFIIPVLSIVESLRPTAGMLSSVKGKGELLNIRGELMPLFRMGQLFGLADAVDDPTQGLVIVLQSGTRRIGIMVDELIGQQQTVIKSLSQAVGKKEYISGAAIMSDGRVGLILDADGLMKLAETIQVPSFTGEG